MSLTYSIFTILHPHCKIGLVDIKVALLIAGPQMLAVTQQIPTSSLGKPETKMSE